MLVLGGILAFLNLNSALVSVTVLFVFPFLNLLPTEFIGYLPDVISSRFFKFADLMREGNNSWDTNNLTVLSFATNFEVMKSTLFQGRWYGNGFCGHSPAYQRYFENTEFVNHMSYGTNAIPAHCLTIRTISEFGVIGVVGFIAGIGRLITSKRNDIWFLFGLAAIASRSLKLGSWVDYGLPIFLLAPFFLPQEHDDDNLTCYEDNK